jgi:Domain of unknown function (DUF397)
MLSPMADLGGENRVISRVALDNLCWRKSSKSTFNGNCVEIAITSGPVLVRDSKNPGTVLQFDRNVWATFIDRLKQERVLSRHRALWAR